jgi:hypothetical protein
MLYALLCYNDEDVVWSWTKEEDDAVMGRLAVVHERLIKAGKLGPSLRLMPTTTATTFRKNQDLVIDGPFAETKELISGFWVIEVKSLDEAISWAKRVPQLNGQGPANIEIRPYFEAEDFAYLGEAAKH